MKKNSIKKDSFAGNCSENPKGEPAEFCSVSYGKGNGPHHPAAAGDQAVAQEGKTSVQGKSKVFKEISGPPPGPPAEAKEDESREDSARRSH